MVMNNRTLPYALLMFCVIGIMKVAIAAEASAQLDAQTVYVGEAVQLSVTITGGNAAAPEIPEIKNLTVQYQGQSSQFSMINGVTSRSVGHSYVIGSQVAGDYQIPPIEVNVGGQIVKTQALSLKVLADGSTPGVNNADAEKEANDPKRFGFLTVELASQNRKYAYVGELAPVCIKAWLPSDSQVSLRSGIQPESKGFTLRNGNLQPQQSQEVKDGKQYTVLTWFAGMAATKAGNLPASLSLKIDCSVPDRSKPQLRARQGSIFGRLNTAYIKKEVTLASENQQIEVRALPTEGRPAGFVGAVGDYQIDAFEMPSVWKTGEPQQVRVRLKGSGNFASVQAPALVPEESWKTYPGQDQFTPADNASFSGSKIFQYNAVVRTAKIQEALFQFSYFDPDDGQYKTVQSTKQAIQVTGDEIPADVVANDSEPVVPDPKTPGDTLADWHTKDSSATSLQALADRPAMSLWLMAATLVAMLGPLGALLRWYLQQPQRLAARALQNETKSALQQVDQCAQKNDLFGFISAARATLQIQLAAIWKKPAHSITLTELSQRLPVDSPVNQFFREVDQHLYGASESLTISADIRALFQRALSSLQSSK